MGFVDGQTTNPSLISKNPVIQAQVASGHKLSLEQQTQEYKKIVRLYLWTLRGILYQHG
jgi:transaldolase